MRFGSTTVTANGVNLGPLAGSVVPRAVTIELFFDRLLLPSNVNRQAVCLRPLAENVESLEQCADPSPHFTEPEYRPVTRSVVYRVKADTPLAADTSYVLTVFRAEDPQAQHGFFAFDEAPLLANVRIDFKTSAEMGTPEPQPSPESWCAGPAVTGARKFFNDCAFGGCHQPSTSGDAAASMGLDLRPEGIEATAFNVTAHQTQTGQQADIADLSGDRFGRAMPIIRPGDPGNSYLIYKLIANPLHHPRENACPNGQPTGCLEPQLAAEIARLRASVVVGLPMPAESGKPAIVSATGPGNQSLIGNDAMLFINSWIAHGAPLACP